MLQTLRIVMFITRAMITVAQAVSEMVTKDELASEALAAGMLNLSAYTDIIHKQVEKATFKEVKRGTIVVALSRLAKLPSKGKKPLKPDVKIDNLSVKSALCSLTYDKTLDTQRNVAVLNPFKVSISDLFSVTESASEITLICTQRVLASVRQHMGPPKSEVGDLVAVTAYVGKKYARLPNLHYVLFSALASKRIPIVEIVTSYTEISFIVDKKDMEETVKTLNVYS